MKSLKEYICPNPSPKDINIDKLNPDDLNNDMGDLIDENNK